VLDHPRRLVWLVNTLDKLKGFPEGIQQKLGFALYQAQIDQRHESTKPLHGFGLPVWEVRANDRSGTYRAVYLVHVGDAVYVLHAFQKKSRSGATTPKREIELIRQRLKLARELSSQAGG
jgi:phage-related protein